MFLKYTSSCDLNATQSSDLRFLYQSFVRCNFSHLLKQLDVLKVNREQSAARLRTRVFQPLLHNNIMQPLGVYIAIRGYSSITQTISKTNLEASRHIKKKMVSKTALIKHHLLQVTHLECIYMGGYRWREDNTPQPGQS